MGREILYCTSCQTQLREADFEKDRAFRIQNRAYCADCAQGQIASLTPEQMKSLLRKIADPSTAARPSSLTARPSSSSKMPRQAARKAGAGPFIGIALGSAALVILVWFLLSSAPSSRPPTPPPVVVRPVPVPVPVPVPAPRPAEGPDLVKEIAALDERARPLLARESFQAVADLYVSARARFEDTQWKALLDGKAADARKDAQRLFDSLKAHAAEARRTGKMDQVKALQIRVAAWGLSDLTAALESHLASIPEGRAWVPIFDGRTADFLNPADRAHWHVQDGAVTQKTDKWGAAQSLGTWGDGDFRIRFEVAKASLVIFTVRQSAKGSYSVGIIGDQIRALVPGPHEFIIVCRGASVTATLDGRPTQVESGGPSPSGHIQFNSSDGTMRVVAVDFRAPTP